MKDEIIFTPFYSSFLRLCKKKNLSPTAVAKEAGISSGAPTAWKYNGAIPRPEQLKKLCMFFNVSENELLGYSEQKESPPQGGELSNETLLNVVKSTDDDAFLLEIMSAVTARMKERSERKIKK